MVNYDFRKGDLVRFVLRRDVRSLANVLEQDSPNGSLNKMGTQIYVDKASYEVTGIVQSYSTKKSTKRAKNSPVPLWVKTVPQSRKNVRLLRVIPGIDFDNVEFLRRRSESQGDYDNPSGRYLSAS